MCLSCGCKQPDDAHGDERNITMQGLQDAAKAAEITPAEVVRNIEVGFGEWGSRPMAATGAKQGTGNNQPRMDDRQGGYGSGQSSGPQ